MPPGPPEGLHYPYRPPGGSFNLVQPTSTAFVPLPALRESCTTSAGTPGGPTNPRQSSGTSFNEYRPSQRPPDHYQTPERASRPILPLWEDFPTTTDLSWASGRAALPLLTHWEGLPTPPVPLEGSPDPNQPLPGPWDDLPTTHSPSEWPYDPCWPFGRASRPLNAHQEGLSTTAGPPGGPPDHSRPCGRTVDPSWTCGRAS